MEGGCYRYVRDIKGIYCYHCFERILAKEANMRRYLVLGTVILASMALLIFGCQKAEEPGTMEAPGPGTAFYTIGTGGVTGVYYPTGGAIARVVNKKKDEYGIRMTVESTGGSVFNINAIMAGDLEFGVVQSDRQYQAINGLAEWKDKGKQEDLRALFAVHPESITLCVGVDTGINSIQDLKGKRINIGNPGSGQRQNSIDALEGAGINYENDIQAESLKAAEAPGLLQDGRVDGFFYTVGHPSGAFKEATSGTRKVKFVPIELPASFYEKFPYYAPSIVPVSNYPGAENDADVPTFGVKATFVTSAKVPEDHVYAVVKEIFENFEDFRKLHPAYSVLTKANMLEGLSAQLHPGAKKYFEEVGLM
jgi:TRAP transporter TAXI family solute receptor